MISKLIYEVVDCPFNRAVYPDMIGKQLDKPPAYAKVKIIQERGILNGKRSERGKNSKENSKENNKQRSYKG